MPKGEKKLVECLLCNERYSKHSIIEGGFYLESGVCKSCYNKMQLQSQTLSCFGKLPSKKLHGYNSENIVCSSICPDRVACAQYISKLK